MNITTAIQVVINTLDTVEVKGASNLKALSNSMEMLSAVIEAINNAKKEAESGGENEGESNQ